MEEEKLKEGSKETSKISKVGTNEVPMRRIVIEFDNKNINLKVADVSSYFELKGIFETILTKVN